MELGALTPVFGTAQPPAGLSGILRRMAYRVPEHRPRHWMPLMLADRVDVALALIGSAIARRRSTEAAGGEKRR